MFVAETQIFTNSGWKKIEDISGNDKVLVKNFIGDAEFIQPFALKKKKYDGEIIKMGGKDWSVIVTPDHETVYTTLNVVTETIHKVPAGEIEAKPHYRVHRKFKYIFPDDPPKEYITIYDEFGKRTVTISHHDWYKLVGYVLTRGFISRENKRPMLWLFLEEARFEEELQSIGEILDRIGVPWSVQYTEKTSPKIVVSSRNTLASRLRTRLGSFKRKEMYLPDKMIYNSSKELTKLLVDTIIGCSIKTTEKKDPYQLATSNIDLIRTLELLGTLGGYGMRHKLKTKAGTQLPNGVTKRDSYILTISSPVSTYTITNVQKEKYSGYVYGIDLFEGQVYIKNGVSPIWVNPK